MKTRVYIAGPISRGSLEHNVKMSTDAFRALAARGYAPFCPQLSVYVDGPEPKALAGGLDHAGWLSVDLPWVAVSHAVLRLPGESTGADQETALACQRGIPVFHSIEDLCDRLPARQVDATGNSGGDPRYLALLEQMSRLHIKKAADYGGDGDPLANIRAARDIGLPPSVGSWLRAQDKVHRIKQYFKKGSLANESVDDSLQDLAAYCLLTMIFLSEERQAAKSA